MSQGCAEPQLLLAALELLSSLGTIFVPPDSQVMKPYYYSEAFSFHVLATLS